MRTIAGHVPGGDAVVAEALHPRRDAVVAAVDGDDQRAAGGRPRDHRRVVGLIAAVLGEERPVGAGDHRGELLRQLDHHRRRAAEGVAQLALPGGGVVHDLVVVAQDHRPVGAHVVDEVVAVDVGEVRARALLGEERIGRRRHQRRRAEVAGDAAGDDLGGAHEELLGAGERVRVHGVRLLSLRLRSRVRPGRLRPPAPGTCPPCRAPARACRPWQRGPTAARRR